VGDLNESNVLVTDDAQVVFLDTDSWQIFDPVGHTVYRCCVCKPDFLPAELQGRSLETLDRQPWHDNFALAVLIFKLANEGCHPFDGCYHGSGDPPPMAERIAAGGFPYRDRSGRWSPKPSAPPFSALHPTLQRLFAEVFEFGRTKPEQRPDARTWQEALARAELEFRRCSRNPYHWAWRTPCPWCERQSLLGGLDPFPERHSTPAIRPGSRQARTAACNAPSNPPAPPQPTLPTPAASDGHQALVALALVVGATLILLLWVAFGVVWTCLVAIGLGIGMLLIAWIANQSKQNKGP